MNRSEAAKTAATLMALYPNHKLGDDSEAGYALALADAPYATVTALMPQIMDAHPTFCPGPAQLRAFVKNATSSSTSGWEAGWEAVVQQRADNHLWRPWTLDDPITERAVRAIGVEAICMVDADQENTLRAQFRQLYTGFAATVEREALREQVVAAIADGPTDERIVGLGAGLKRMPSLNGAAS